MEPCHDLAQSNRSEKYGKTTNGMATAVPAALGATISPIPDWDIVLVNFSRSGQRRQRRCGAALCHGGPKALSFRDASFGLDQETKLLISC
jgi:hypothetical protein